MGRHSATLECLPPPLLIMKIIDVKRLSEMIQDMQDLDDLNQLGLTKKEIEGYLEFFAINFVTPLATVIKGSKYDKHQR